MLFNVALSCGLLFVPAALGLPSRLDARITRRREGRQSQVSNSLDLVDGLDFNASAIYTTMLSGNWAGAAWDKDDGTFTSVVGTFTVPTPSGAIGSAASAWIGIDGYTCRSALFQTGVDFTVSSNGQPTYDAWYEWYPDYAHDFSGISISAGDTIELSLIVYATTMKSGFATIVNISNGQTASVDVGSSASLCGKNAEWIVEDFLKDGNLVPFTNFDTVTFENAATGGRGTYTPSGADIFLLDQDNRILTSVSTSGSSVTIKHL